MDVLWLDIEYSPDRKYFIWNDKTFPDPVEMVNDVAATGRKVSDSQLCLQNSYSD
jgi:alpha 1,3-glucosidase